MNRPQVTLSLLLGLVAWALSAMPAPRAIAAADAHAVAARACGWLDVADGAVEGASPLEGTVATATAPPVNTLRFRMAPSPDPQPRRAVAPQVVAPVPCQTVEPLVRWRDTSDLPLADDPDAPIVWLVPMASRWAQRPTVESAQRIGYLLTGNLGAWAVPRYGRPAPRPVAETRQHGIGLTAAVSASAWLGDRCPILTRVRPAAPEPPAAASSDERASQRDAAVTLAAVFSGMAAVLEDWSSRLEHVAGHEPADDAAVETQVAIPDASGADWSQPTASLMILGL